MRIQSGISHLAGWQSGYAAACKAVYAGSIPTSASSIKQTAPLRRRFAFFACDSAEPAANFATKIAGHFANVLNATDVVRVLHYAMPYASGARLACASRHA